MGKSGGWMGGLAEELGGWEVEILLLSSLLLQVLLLTISEWRRRASRWALLSGALNGILWLLYQLADSVAIYVLGHMALSCKPREQQQLMAFWASLLLVHLGGQDTITAYAMEDNDLWLRHLLTLVVQAAGAAYVVYKYVEGGALLVASVLMFLVGVVKYGERIYALKSSGLDSIRKFLDGFEVLDRDKRYTAASAACLDDPEEVLQGAHDLLHICMGQLVDYRVWPSVFQTGAILAYHGHRTRATAARRSMLPQLVGMQLSLVRDILYTKAMVIGSWYGCLSRIVSIVATVVAFRLFQASTSTMGGGRGYNRLDMAVTYILLAGAFFLESVSLLRTAMSTWTCAWLRASGWDPLNATVASLRRRVKAAQRCRKWSGSIGQHDIFKLHRYRRKRSRCYLWMTCFGLEQRWSRLRFFDSLVMSQDVEDLVVKEIKRMIEAYVRKNRNRTMSGPGQLALGGWGKNGAGASLYAGVVELEEAGFDGCILAWHYATDAFFHTHIFNVPTRHGEETRRRKGLAKAIRTLSRYMVFLLVERPHLLPSPVRRSQYDSFCTNFHGFRDNRRGQQGTYDNQPEVQLAYKVLNECDKRDGVERVLRLVSLVWVEMLCYAASHCSNDSHARQLSSGTEFITVTWILTTFLYYQSEHEDPRFIKIARYFLRRHQRRREEMQEALSTLVSGSRM